MLLPSWLRPLKRLAAGALPRYRQFARLMYHASGVVCPVTFAMHLAAAIQVKPGRPRNRACVVVAGIYGGVTALRTILYLQAAPALLALVVLLLSRPRALRSAAGG